MASAKSLALLLGVAAMSNGSPILSRSSPAHSIFPRQEAATNVTTEAEAPAEGDSTIEASLCDNANLVDPVG